MIKQFIDTYLYSDIPQMKFNHSKFVDNINFDKMDSIEESRVIQNIPKLNNENEYPLIYKILGFNNYPKFLKWYRPNATKIDWLKLLKIKNIPKERILKIKLYLIINMFDIY